MLVLSRKNDESVVVGGIDGLKQVKVIVLAIDRGGVKLGFEAPRDVPVYREEVWERLVVDRPAEADTTAHGALDQWADDGGLQLSNGQARGTRH
jgi:carbon storage regulator